MNIKSLSRSQKEELRDRVDAHKKRIEARLHELRAEGSEKSRALAQDLEEKLKELREQASVGWENFSEEIAGKINRCLKKLDGSES